MKIHSEANRYYHIEREHKNEVMLGAVAIIALSFMLGALIVLAMVKI